MDEFKQGDIIEGYRVLKLLGKGAASIIYLVVDQRTKQVWALKHVVKENTKDQRFLDQTENEYRIASALNHPNIRKIDRLVRKRERLLTVREMYLVMEMLDGVTMDQRPPKTFVEAVWVFHQIAEALAYMHDHGFVHADMKPNNVVLTDSGSKTPGRIAKLIDLGQSCRVGTVKPRIQGTPDYIAPEQVHRRAITGKTDIFNLGATMYWTLTMRNIPTALAKDSSLVGSLDDHMIEKPTPAAELNPRIHPKLSELVMQCVEVDPTSRPESMHQVADRLNLILGIVRVEAERKINSESRADMVSPAEQERSSGGGTAPPAA